MAKLQDGQVWTVRLYTTGKEPLASQHFSEEAEARRYGGILEQQGYRYTTEGIPWAEAPEKARCAVIASTGWGWLHQKALTQQLPRLGGVPQSTEYHDLYARISAAVLEPSEAKLTEAFSELVTLCRRGV